MVSLLDTKLLRDFRRIKGQALAVGLVMACGLAMMVMTRSLIISLREKIDAYYESHRFAHVFAVLKRAPDSVAAEIGEIAGVAGVETSITRQVAIDLPTLLEPATGLLNSLPNFAEPKLNRLFLRRGRFPQLGAQVEAVVSEAFADKNGLGPGSEISAILNGKKTVLRITGVVLSPEFIFESRPGAALPDNRTFGVFWLPYDALAAAFQMDGAFNKVAVRLGPGASEATAIAAVDAVLKPYGGQGAYGRERHQSHVRLRDEMKILEALSFAYPLVFLSVAAFMVHAVMSRQVALQREQIAILKAFGYSNREVGMHLFKLALGIVCVGIVLGSIGGMWLGSRLVELYHQFFRFPSLEFRPAFGTLLAAGGVSALAAFVGVLSAMRKAVALPPAEAMRPEAPTSFRETFLERSRFGKKLRPVVRMALRNIARKPGHAALTCLALSMATGILVIPSAFRDGINHVMDYQWDTAQRNQAMVVIAEGAPLRAQHDFERLPGVIFAEAFRQVPVEIEVGHVNRRVTLSGLPRRPELNRVLGADERPLELPEGGGIILSEKLAVILGVERGSVVRVRGLEGKRTERDVVVVGLATDFAGLAAYMEFGALNRFLDEGERMNGVYVTVAGAKWSEFLQTLKNTPRADVVVIKEALRNSFRETTAKSIGLIQMIYLIFATTVATGIVYNSARISLSERTRELATLRVLGFSQAETAAVLTNELAVLTVCAVPLGLVFGTFAATAIIHTVDTEFVRLPLILNASNYAFAALVVLTASTISALWAARKLRELDMIAVLKVRD